MREKPEKEPPQKGPRHRLFQKEWCEEMVLAAVCRRAERDDPRGSLSVPGSFEAFEVCLKWENLEKLADQNERKNDEWLVA
ncbi:hypothetical protein NL676_021374 [Syzygium grande]|nr:hypothetical protein NL676_021374 [Syzygium grande]